MADQQQPFPVTASGSSASRSGPLLSTSTQQKEAMSDLEQALTLAAAWFGGDAAAEEWAAAPDHSHTRSLDEDELALDASFEQVRLRDDWQADADWQNPEPDLQQPDIDALGSLLGASLSFSTDAVQTDIGHSDQPTAKDGDGNSGASGASHAAAADATPGAVDVLDDIDTEPSAAVAPGIEPVSLAASLGQGNVSAPEPAPPPIIPAPTDIVAAEADPMAALEAAIEADRPKFVPSPEWVKMMEAVRGELEEAGQADQPSLVEGGTPSREGDEESGAAAAPQFHRPGEGGASSVHAAAAEVGNLPQHQEQQHRVADAKMLLEHSPLEEDSAENRSGVVSDVESTPLATPPNQPITDLEQEQKRTFLLLQPICTELLLQRADPQRMADVLRTLEAALQDVSQNGLQHCFDYVLFPLIMMLEALAVTRQQQQQQQQQQQTKVAVGEAAALMALPAMTADRAAEAALACTLCVLRRCSFHTGDGLLSMLRRLAAILELPDSAASEEIKIQALLCLEASTQGVLKPTAPKELRETLLDEAAAPILGYLSSLTLQIADAQLQLGNNGSRAVRERALTALTRLLEAVVGPSVEHEPALTTPYFRVADALAFFLPGVAVGLCKAMLAATGRSSSDSNSVPSGPACSSAAAVAALEGLATVVSGCLNDAAVQGVLHGLAPGEGSAGQDSNMTDVEALDSSSSGLQEAVKQLQLLSQKSRSSNNEAVSQAPSQPPPLQQQEQPRGEQQPGPRQQIRLRVQRSEDWVHSSAARLHGLLSTALPPLLRHQHHAVRGALVRVCCRLLNQCSMALQRQTQQVLLQLLLSAAQDDWQEVAAPARSWLQLHARVIASESTTDRAAVLPAAGSGFSAALEELLLELIRGLPAALRDGDQLGRQHAYRLTSAFQICSPMWFARSLVHHPLRLQELLTSLVEGFTFDASVAGMLLYSAATPSGAATAHAPPTSSSDNLLQSSMSNNPAAAVSQHPAARPGPQGAILLPRMTPGLALVTTAATYEALASAVRSCAALAVAADAAFGGRGSTLHALIDGCLARLRQTVSREDASHNTSQHSGLQAVEGSVAQRDAAWPAGCGPWQLQAASAVAVLAELLFGASPGWEPRWRIQSVEPQLSGDSILELESLAMAVMQDLVCEAVWSLPTERPVPAHDANSHPNDQPMLPPPASDNDGPGQVTAQQRGCNAILVKAALECCGAAARALGQRFSQHGRLLRTVLLPICEKLVNGSQLVSNAASAALASVCCWCGYGGSLQRLVAANADYIVDAFCAQLRQLESHPRAPQLFTALLQQAGVAPELLPVLAEPARNAVQGLSVLARRQQPQHVLAFLQALLPVVGAAEVLARQALQDIRLVAEEVQRRSKQLQREREEAEAAAGGAEVVTQARIRRFFERRQQTEEERQKDKEGHLLETAASDEITKVGMSATEREQVSLLRRHLHAAGILAQAAADGVSPLATAQTLEVAVQSFHVGIQALRVLAAVTEAVELDTNKIQSLIQKPAELSAPDPADTPRLLPSVHLAWVPLMGALQDWRVSVLESALRFLADVTCLAGTFLRKRLAREALPVVLRLLNDGPARRNIIAPGQDDLVSPGAVQRVQIAMLRCLQQIASCDNVPAIAGISGSGGEALLASAQPLLSAVGDMLGGQHEFAIREQATHTYVALAKIDPDAAWCQISACLCGKQPTGGTTLQVVGLTAEPNKPPPLHLKSTTRPLLFMEIQPALVENGVPKGLEACSVTKLEALARQAQQIRPPWHHHVELQAAC